MWSSVVLEKLFFPQVIKKFLALYVTRSFITAFARALHLSPFWARAIQSKPPILFLKLFSYVFPSTPLSSKWYHSFRFQNQNPAFPSPLSYAIYIPLPYYSPEFITRLVFGNATAVAQWLKCCTTNRKLAGSIPAGFSGFFHWRKILPIALWPWGRLSL